MKLESLRELLITECQDLYSAEQQIIDALPKMAEEASAPELKSAFKQHLEQTKSHLMRLDQVFRSFPDEDKDDKTCKGMQGLIKEGKEMIKQDGEPEVKDAGLIAAAQRVEHYEIASYGCARTYAQLLGMNDVARLLQQTLDEEGDTDKKLTAIAERINVEAKAA
jgi:ferritin-like metal-binding protein YciE